MNLRDWLDPMLQEWGAQKRRVWFGSRNHCEGYPDCSTLGRILEEKVAAGERSPLRMQRWTEVYQGDGLTIQRAIQGLPELPNKVIHAHYVILLPRDPFHSFTALKAGALGISIATYKAKRECAWYYLSGRLDMPQQQRQACG